jgi:hypothetical protein
MGIAVQVLERFTMRFEIPRAVALSVLDRGRWLVRIAMRASRDGNGVWRVVEKSSTSGFGRRYDTTKGSIWCVAVRLVLGLAW